MADKNILERAIDEVTWVVNEVFGSTNSSGSQSSSDSKASDSKAEEKKN